MYIFFVLVLAAVSSALNVSEQDYNLLPPVFHIDPLETCPANQYVVVEIELLPINPQQPSKEWLIIKQTKSDKRYYDHGSLHYSLCATNITTPTDLTKMLNQKYEPLGLKAKLKEYKDQLLPLTPEFIDYAFLVFLICLVGITCIATTSKNINPYLTAFSIRANLEKLKKNYVNDQFLEMKAIQGLRFFTTTMIIFCHTFCSFAGAYVKDTRYLEEFSNNWFKHGVQNSFLFLVQSFFLVSGWLLAYNSFKLFENGGRVTSLKFVVLTLLNRYLRIVPHVLLITGIVGTVWIHPPFRGPVGAVYSDIEFKNCRTYWWTSLLFINNHVKASEACVMTTWYLSADTQLYVISLLLIVLACNYPRRAFQILFISFVLSAFIQAFVTFYYDLDIIYRLTPIQAFEDFRKPNIENFPFTAIYQSTYTNAASYMLGVLFGYVYHKCQKVGCTVISKWRHLVWPLFLAGPLFVLYITQYHYGRLNASLVALILRPLYSFGIGIGMFGMSFQYWPWLRAIFEFKPIVFLGQITYSTYMIHFLKVFMRSTTAVKPLEVNNWILARSGIEDVILGFALGFFIYLVIEMPCVELQRLLVPKIQSKIKKK